MPPRAGELSALPTANSVARWMFVSTFLDGETTAQLEADDAEEWSKDHCRIAASKTNGRGDLTEHRFGVGCVRWIVGHRRGKLRIEGAHPAHCGRLQAQRDLHRRAVRG